MSFPLWEPIHEDTKPPELVGTTVLFYRDDERRGVVATFRRDDYDNIIMQFARTPHLDSWGILTPSRYTFISATGAGLFSSRSAQIVAIPPVVWRHRRGGVRGRTPTVMAATTICLVALLAINTAFAAAVAIPVAFLVGTALWFMLRKVEPTYLKTPGGLELDGTNIVQYAQQRRLGHRPEMLRSEQRHSLTIERVTVIREEFEDLRSDIVYRIDNSALFDSAVPATEHFQMALMAWDDAENVSLDELDALAADVEITYSVARDNAETLGLSHLPEASRPDGRRAAKAARLAVDSPNEGEREASRRQLIRILNSLALYWLPDVSETMLALEGSPSATRAEERQH